MLFKDQARPFLHLRFKAEEAARDAPALMIRAERAVASLMHGEHNQRRAGHGLQFWQFREYLAGDRPQDIDWRQSGKTERIFIRQKEHQTPQSALFWCAHSPGMDFHSKSKYPLKKDTAQTLCLALAILIAQAGDQVGFLGDVRTGRSDAALDRLARALIENKDGAELPNAHAAKIAKNTTLIMAGDFLAPIEKISSQFKALAAQGGRSAVIQVLDPAEIDFPFGGRILFKHPGDAYEYKIESAASIRDAYREKMEEHQTELANLCRQYGWHYVLHRTDASLSKTLGSIAHVLGNDPRNLMRSA